MLTGRYPELVGVPGVIRTHPENSWGYLDRPMPSCCRQLLRGAGYHTAIVGKWHLGLESPNTPNERGFDFFHGFLGDMMDDYFTHRRHDVNYMRRNAARSIRPATQRICSPNGLAITCDALRARAMRGRRRSGPSFCIWPTTLRTLRSNRPRIGWRKFGRADPRWIPDERSWRR